MSQAFIYKRWWASFTYASVSRYKFQRCLSVHLFDYVRVKNRDQMQRNEQSQGTIFQSMTRNVNKYLIQNSKYVYCLCIQHTIRFCGERRLPVNAKYAKAKTWEKALKQFIYFPSFHTLNIWPMRTHLFFGISQAYSMSNGPDWRASMCTLSCIFSILNAMEIIAVIRLRS